MDLAAGQNFWTNLFQKIGVVSSVYQLLRRIRRELKESEILIEKYNDPNEFITAISLSGVVLGKYETGLELRHCNTDENGLVYVKIIDNVGDFDIEIYNNSARTDGAGVDDKLIASVAAVAAAGTGTLAEENNSGVSGSVTISAGVAADAIVWLRPKIGLPKQIQDLPIDDNIDSSFIVDMESNLTNVVNNIGTSLTFIESFMRKYMWPYIAKKITTGKNTVSNVSTEVTSGVVTEKWQEILEDFADAMKDETAPGVQYYGTLIGAPADPVVFDADNIGAGKSYTPYDVAIPTYPWMQSMVLTFECTATTIGSEEFKVVGRAQDGSAITAEQRLVVDKNWLSLALGISGLTVVHEPADSGTEAAEFSAWFLFGVTSSNSDDGKLYGMVSGVGTVVKFYSDAGMAASTQVAAGAIAANVLTITEYNDSGISGYAVSAAPADNDINVDIKPFSLKDKFYATLVVTESDDGIIGEGGFYLDALMGVFKFLPRDDTGVALIDQEVGDRGFSGLSTEVGTV